MRWIAGRARRRAGTGMLATAVVAVIAVAAPVAAVPASAAPVDPVALVNPLIGTGSGGQVVGQVDTFPGAAAPFGMLTFSPDTSPTGADGGGYYYGDSQVTGLSLTHISGPGCGAAGDFPILPTSGAVPDNPYTATDSFSHASEHASPGYYSASLGSPGIATRLTATTRTGLADFDFPSGGNGNVLFKVAGSQNGDTNEAVHILGDEEVTGQATSGHFCGSPDTYPVYFAARFDRPFSSSGTWQQSVSGPNLLGSDQTGTLGWGGPDNDGCATNTGSLQSSDGGAAETWTASCTTANTWVQVTPSGLSSGDAYQASVTLEANSSAQTAPVYLDFYNGCVDTTSNTVTLTPGTPVTLTDTSTVGCSNSPQFQVRTAGSGGVDLNISNASLQAVTEQPDPGVTSASGSGPAAYVSFPTTTSRAVQMQVAISYVSTADAWANLQAEQGSGQVDFDRIRATTAASWARELDRIRISGGTAAQRTTFYTALYHALLDPSVFSDDNGEYLGFDGKVHRLAEGQGAQFANFSGWDVYRSEMQLLSLVDPTRTGDMMQSLVNDADQGGWLPKWPLADDYTNVMNGDAADAMIADAWAFGVRNFDAKGALAAMMKGATVVPTASQLGHGWYPERPQIADYLRLGYTPNVESTSLSPVDNGASQTLEYAIDDFGISELAAGLGEQATAATFAQRASNWENLFNPASGYLQPRDGNGDFPTGDPLTVGYGSFGQSGFQEGNAAQYDWAAPQDLGALIDLIGGPAAARQRLDTFFTQLNAGPNEPYYWAGNETDLNAPWVYDYAGDPERTQGLVRRITTSLYGDTPGGEPGNDDLGAMSSWLVWADLGLYPQTAGAPVLVTGSPLFPQAVVRLGLGAALDIRANGAGAGDPYVTSLQVDGRPTQRTWLPVGAVLHAGASLQFDLSPTADPAWGTAAGDAPPSSTAGEAPAVVAPSGQLTVAPGASATGTLEVANATSSPQTVSWSLAAPTGSGLSAASGRSVVPIGGGRIPISLSASSTAAQGFSTVTVSARDGNRSLPTENLTVLVAPAGSLLASFDNRGVSSDTDPTAADFDGGGYSYSEQALAAAGVQPGGTVTVGSASYTWPDVAAGEPDNVVADGQVIDVAAADGASNLDLLASATNGPSSGTVTLTYTDGSTATAALAVTDWAAGSLQAGNTVAASCAYRNSASGSTVYGATDVYSVAVPVDPSKTLASVTLPTSVDQGEIHVFALTTS